MKDVARNAAEPLEKNAAELLVQGSNALKRVQGSRGGVLSTLLHSQTPKLLNSYKYFKVQGSKPSGLSWFAHRGGEAAVPGSKFKRSGAAGSRFKCAEARSRFKNGRGRCMLLMLLKLFLY